MSDALIRAPRSFEEVMSLLTAAIGSLEGLQGLGPAQQDRVRQAVIRLSNLERRYSRGI